MHANSASQLYIGLPLASEGNLGVFNFLAESVKLYRSSGNMIETEKYKESQVLIIDLAI